MEEVVWGVRRAVRRPAEQQGSISTIFRCIGDNTSWAGRYGSYLWWWGTGLRRLSIWLTYEAGYFKVRGGAAGSRQQSGGGMTRVLAGESCGGNTASALGHNFRGNGDLRWDID